MAAVCAVGDVVILRCARFVRASAARRKERGHKKVLDFSCYTYLLVHLLLVQWSENRLLYDTVCVLYML